LDTILPPKKSMEFGQINMQFVSCNPATKMDVIKLYVRFKIHKIIIYYLLTISIHLKVK